MRKFIVLAALFAGCNPPPQPAPVPGTMVATGETIATVNGEAITQDMLDAVTGRMPPQQVEMMKKTGQMQQLKERIALGQLLYKEALKRGLEQKPDVQLSLALAQRDVLAAEVLEVISEEGITDEKLQEAYDKRAVQYKRPEVRARHILLKDKAQADEILGKLQAGADFAALAAEYSADPGSKVKGGELGWFQKERMVAPFAKAAFEAEKGAVVGPVESQFGFHIIEVEDKRDGVPLEDVKEELKRSLQGEVVQAYLDELKKGATIEYVGGEEAPAAPMPGMPKAAPAPKAIPAPTGAPAPAHEGGEHK